MRHDDKVSRGEPRAILRISIKDMVQLRVRAKKPDKPLPKYLYQLLPADAMTLMATIPVGTAAVSILQQKNRRRIFQTFPPAEDNIVVVYARKINGRYEAVEVLSQKESYAVDRFCEFSRRWVQNNRGGLKTIPRRYAYFAPTRDEWEAILRDGGFAAIDPTNMVFNITPKLLKQRQESSNSGVIARIPVQTSCRSPEADPLAVFSQVELIPDPNPIPASHWVSFVEFQRLRAIRSRPPEAIVHRFREWLGALASAGGFASWCFRRGMFFGDHIEWWGDRNRRRTLHEGIDFAEGYLPDGKWQHIPEGTRVHAIADGEIIGVLNDFLNKTVVVRHSSIRDTNGDVFHTIFSHIDPADTRLGPVIQGQSVGNVARSKQVGVPAHLHLTGAWIPAPVPAREVTMDIIHPAYMPFVLTNFNSLLVDSKQ